MIFNMSALIADAPSGGGTVDFSPFSQIVWGTITPATDLSGMIPQSTFGLQGNGQIQFAGLQVISDEAPTGKTIVISSAQSYNKFGSNPGEKYASYLITSSGVNQSHWIENWGEYGVFLSPSLRAGVTYRYIICLGE